MKITYYVQTRHRPPDHDKLTTTDHGTDLTGALDTAKTVGGKVFMVVPTSADGVTVHHQVGGK